MVFWMMAGSSAGPEWVEVLMEGILSAHRATLDGMRHLLVLLPVLAVVLVGCTPEYRSNFVQLKDGMSEAEVRELLGKPSVVVPPRTDKDGNVVQGARWQYGDNLSTWTTSAAYPENEPERVWIVWFDPEGRVIASRAPTWMKPADKNTDSNFRQNDIFEPLAPPHSR